MTLLEIGLGLGLRIHKASHKPPTIGNGKLQGRRSGALVMAGAIVAIPRQHARHRSVHARSHQERHAVLDLCVVAHGNDAIPDNSNGKREQHNHAAERKSVRQQGDEDGANGRNSIWRHGPELSRVRIMCEFQIVDDGRQEEAKGIETA